MRRYASRVLTLAAVAVTTAACGSAGMEGSSGDTAAGGRYQVLIPGLVAADGSASREGDQVANQLRGLVSNMATHTAVPEREIRRAMGQYEVERLDEITTRQLAQQMRAPLTMWGTVSQGGQGLQADVRFVDVASGDEIVLERLTGANPNQLAQAIFQGFESSIEGIRQAAFCNDYLSSQQYDRAIETCDRALAIVPRSTAALYGKATALLNLERDAEALQVYQTLLEVDPAHQDALLGAGLAASRQEQSDVAMGFYSRYMELDPDNVQVRMTVAHDIFQTGDVISAYRMLEPAVATNQDNMDFQRYFFSIAAAAGQRVLEQQDRAAARPYLESAMNAYTAAFSAPDVEMDAAILRQAIAVNNALGRTDQALALAQQATQRFADDAAVWSVYSTVLADAGRAAEAVRALDRVIQIDPAYPDAYIRRALQRLEAGQRQAALADLERAAATNRENVARVVLRMGSEALNANRFQEAETTLALAQQYASGEMRAQVSFLQGFAVYRQAEAIARANTRGDVAQARRAVALFQRAEPLVRAGQHAQRDQVLGAIQQYLDNQQAIIRAGTRGR
jgi:tetratricopeptide (TPR) repeat protein